MRLGDGKLGAEAVFAKSARGPAKAAAAGTTRALSLNRERERTRQRVVERLESHAEPHRFATKRLHSIDFRGVQVRLILQPDGAFRLGDYLRTNLQEGKWTEFKAAVAFAKRSGVKHIRADLAAFSAQRIVRLAIGIDCNGTSREGLEDLLSAVGTAGQLHVFHNEQESTFHPKLYLFKNDREATVAIGSGNLTQGGLFTNYEASVAVALDLSKREDSALLREVEAAIDGWTDPRNPTTRRLDPDLLVKLVEQGYVLPEERTRGFGDEPRSRTTRLTAPPVGEAERLFARVAVRRAPSVAALEPRPTTAEAARPAFDGFVMTLMQTDVGYGQMTKGTSRRSPEVFIPLEARDFAPEFWGWPDLFRQAATKWDRWGVMMRVGTRIVPINMMVWKKKHDLRLRSEAIRRAASVGDIIRISKADEETAGYSYDVEIIPQGTPAYDSYLALCTHAVRNSQKRWGHY